MPKIIISINSRIYNQILHPLSFKIPKNYKITSQYLISFVKYTNNILSKFYLYLILSPIEQQFQSFLGSPYSFYHFSQDIQCYR